MRSFHVICPFCDGAYPFPNDLDEVYKCQCGAAYKIAWRSDIEGAVDELIEFFLKHRQTPEAGSESNVLCNAVVYEDIENLITMKREYEASKYIRKSLSFDQNYPKKVGLIWLGSYTGADHVEGRDLRFEEGGQFMNQVERLSHTKDYG